MVNSIPDSGSLSVLQLRQKLLGGSGWAEDIYSMNELGVFEIDKG